MQNQTFAERLSIPEGYDYIPGQCGMLCIMDRTGDIRKMWNSANRDEVEDARRSFNDFKAKGYAAFRVNDDGTKGEQIREFNAEAGKIILTPPMAGG